MPVLVTSSRSVRIYWSRLSHPARDEEIVVITHKKSKKELWESLQGYHFANLVPIHLTDRVVEMFGGKDASTKAFANKLSRKLGWTAEFAFPAIPQSNTFSFLALIHTKNITHS